MVALVLVVALLLLGLAGLLLLALLAPVRVAAEGVFTRERVDVMADASWCFGAVGVRASLSDGAVVTFLGRPVRHLRAWWSPADVTRRPRAPARAVWRPGLHVVRRVASSLRLRVRVAGRLGTGDPADTATVYGLVGAARGLVPALDLSDLRVDWAEPALDLEGRLDGRVWPAAIAWIVASDYVRSRGSHRAREVMR